MKRVSKETKRKVLEALRKASSEEYEASWDDEGRVKTKSKIKIKKGKKSKSSGGQFELKVRKDLEEKGWIVDKWTNNVDLAEGRVVAAKRKFNPFSRVMSIGTGFPDFVCFQLVGDGRYNVVGFEVKQTGVLSKEEKEKGAFLLRAKVFNDLFIAKRGEQRGAIEYVDFKERYGRFLDARNTPRAQEEEGSSA